MMEENTEPGTEEVEEVNKSAGDVTETSVVKEEKSETPVKTKRRRTELKSDVQKSISGKDILAEVNSFSKFLDSEIKAQQSKQSSSSNEAEEDEGGNTGNAETGVKKISKKQRKSPVEKEEDQSESDLSVELLNREPEVDLSSSAYFMSKKTMIVSISSERLKDPGFVEKIHRDENLPENWFTYITIYSNGTRKIREFVTPDRRIIRSIEGLAEFMRISNKYSEEQIEKVMAGVSKVSRSRRKAQSDEV